MSSLYQIVTLEENNYYGVSPEIAKQYIERLTDHITYVREAGRGIGVRHDQLAIHDASKWTPEEFPAYAMYFVGNVKDQSPVDNPNTGDDFAAAWLHHIHYNPHHWQHWIFFDGWQPKNSSLENGVMAMPENYALEMIADWMGAGRAYTGSWDMTDWLLANIPRIRLHSKTALYVMSLLDKFGYPEIPLRVQFGSALK